MRKGFSRRRGRPCLPKPAIDTGTPELAGKRRLGHTAEVIDLLHGKGLITEAELWCALHFRWLYALRYGAPTLQALDLSHRAAYHPPQDREDGWYVRRALEYRQAAETLQQEGVLGTMLDMAVFGAKDSGKPPSPATLRQFRKGLAILTLLWKR